jgi:hypothetical protein
MTQFVPAADEVSRLQRGSDPECRLFQKVAEQGHYAGRTVPSGTRQGTYATAPSGVLLASINSNDPERMAGMLEEALARWQTLSREERLLPEDPRASVGELSRYEEFYPRNGLVLRVNSRDLPRQEQAADWRGSAWNQDYTWFTKDEARLLVPEKPVAGQRREVPELIPHRIARCSLVDNVRGQTWPYAPEDVRHARLTSEVIAVDGDVLTLRLTGATQTVAEGIWCIAGYRDMHNPTPQKRGFEAHLSGGAKYDLKQEQFVAFEMVALGTRFGGTQYNGRHDDLAPAPIGVAFTLAGDSPAERVAPAYLHSYGWAGLPEYRRRR